MFVGADKDSAARQRTAIGTYAAAHGITIVAEYYDAAVSGCDPVDTRPGFAAMIAEHSASTILVESASRFARDLIVQETGYAYSS